MPRAELKAINLRAVLAAGALSAFAAVSAPAQEALSLSAALKEALSRSEEALLLEEKERHVEAQKREVWAEAFPTINATASAGRGNTVMDASMFSGAFGGGGDSAGGGGGAPSGAFSFTQNRFAYALDAYQPLFSFGRLSTAVKAANAQEDAEANDRRNTRHQLQMQVLDAYYRYMTAKAYLGTLESSVKRFRETQAFLESNFRMGAGIRANVLRALTALKSLEPQRINAERDAEAARMHLNRLLGRELTAPLELDTTDVLAMEAIPEQPDAKALEEVVGNRPDVRQMALTRKSMEGRARYVKMLYLPSLGATGKIGVTAFDTDQLFEFEKNKEWSFGVGLNWNLFDGGAKLAKARQTESQARQLRLNEQMVRKAALVQIESAYRDYRASDTALAAAEQAVAAAREAQAMLSQDFRAGKGQITDLLETEEALRQSEFGVLNARYMKVRSQGALRLALGKGLITEEAP
jgi:outer membrane protein